VCCVEKFDSEKEKKVRLFFVFFFLFRPFFSSSLSFKRYAQTDNERKEKEQRHVTTQPRTARRQQLQQKNSGRKAVSLSLLPSKITCTKREREREREKERQRESKKESAKNLFLLRETFFFLCEKKKAHLSSHLISSLLERLRESRCKETEEKEEEEVVVEEVVRRVKESSRLSRRKCEENERQRNRWWIILRVKGVKEKISPHRLSGGVRGARSNSR
jgi:hypothetical protein